MYRTLLIGGAQRDRLILVKVIFLTSVMVFANDWLHFCVR